MAKVALGLKCSSPFTVRSFSQKSIQICKVTSAQFSSDKVYPHVSTNTAELKRGTGGRSSFSGKVVTIFGGSGFIGRAVVNKFGKIGSQVICPYRGDVYFMRRLKLCGDLGQILFSPFSLKDEASLFKAMKYSNIVINLIGREYETSNFSFEDVHVKGARAIAKVARECGVETLIHFSALNACEKPTPIIFKKGSQFLASKWRGEQAVREEFPNAIIFRPADVFGPMDRFINYYSNWSRRSIRSLSLWNRGEGIIKQPVFHSDVAKGVINAALDRNAAGQTYQAVGPHRFELSEIIDWFHRVIARGNDRYYARFDLRYDPYIWFKFFLSEKFRPKVRNLNFERLEREHVTDEVDPDLPTLTNLGVDLTTLESRIFYELRFFRQHAYQDPMSLQYLVDVHPAPFAKD